MALTSKLTNIADAIREKTGDSAKLTLDEMAEAIAAITAGGGNTTAEDSLVTRSITEYANNRVTSIGDYVFRSCKQLTSVSFPQVTSIGNNAFYDCTALSSVDFPQVTSIGDYAFNVCENIESVSFPLATSVGKQCLSNCDILRSIDLPKVTIVDDSAFRGNTYLENVFIPQATSINKSAFYQCSHLVRLDLPKVANIAAEAFRFSDLGCLILRSETICTLANVSAFSSTDIGSGAGSIYVPDALVEDYKAATNWSTYADQIKPLSEYVEVSA